MKTKDKDFAQVKDLIKLESKKYNQFDLLDDKGNIIASIDLKDGVENRFTEIVKEKIVKNMTKRISVRELYTYQLINITTNENQTKIIFKAEDNKFFYFDLLTHNLHHYDGNLFKKSHLNYIFNKQSLSQIADSNFPWIKNFIKLIIDVGSNLNKNDFDTFFCGLYNNWKEINCIEILSKLNLYKYDNIQYRSKGWDNNINYKATKPHEILKVSKEIVKFGIKGYFSLNDIIQFQENITIEINNELVIVNDFIIKSIRTFEKYLSATISIDNFRDFITSIIYTGFYSETETLRALYQLVNNYHYKLTTLLRYLFVDSENQGYSVWQRFLSDLYDYVKMINDCEITEYEKYPRYLKTYHDIAVKNYKIKENEIHDKQINEWSEQYKKRLFYQDHKFITVFPEKGQDYVHEGQALHHCVGSYVNRVANGDTYVFFIRYTHSPKKSLLTVQCSGNTLTNIEGQQRRKPNEQEKKFLLKYAEKNKLILNY